VKRLHTAAAMLLLTAACAYASDRAEPATTPAGYREAALELDAAIAAKDEAALERLIAEDFLWVRGSGAKGDKADFIGALLAATNELRGTADGEPFVDRHRFADHWLWRDGGWRLVYAQVTPLPETADPDGG